MKYLNFRSLIGVALLSLLVAGCKPTYTPGQVVGSDGQAAARAAFEKTMASVEAGKADQLWDGLTSNVQNRIENDYREESTEGGLKVASAKLKALKIMRDFLGKNPKIKEVRGVIEAVVIVVEKADGKTREFEMLLDGGNWKLNPYMS